MDTKLQIKVNARTLLGCYNMRKEWKGVVPEDSPIEEYVEFALFAFIHKMGELKLIPTLTEEHASSMLRAMTIPMRGDPWPAVKGALASKEELKEITEGIVRRIKVPAKLEVVPQVLPRAQMPAGIVAEAPATPFELLKKQCPKDALIEAIGQSSNQVMQEAVALVYSQIPKEEWGTAKAKNLVEQVTIYLLQE